MAYEDRKTDVGAFIGEMIERRVLLFGDFTLKSGLKSPYFFNLGAVDDGAGMAVLGDAYAAKLADIADTDGPFDVVFGPAYKGIPLAVAASIALARNHGRDVGLAYNRKEAKDHGEGGRLVGADLAGRKVVLVDDVLTAGTAIREAANIVAESGGTVTAVLVALDRQEVLSDASSQGRTALEDVAEHLRVPCYAIASLQDVIEYLDSSANGDTNRRLALDRIREHRNRDI